MFNSRKVIDPQDSEKNAFGTDFENQIKKIDKMIAHMSTIEFFDANGKKVHAKFPKAIILALRGAVDLQKLMKEVYGIPYLRLSVNTQDPLESFFGVIKGMFGYEARPPLTSFNKRMDHYIIGKLLEEEKVDIFDVQKAVEENYPDFEDQDFDVTKGQGPWTNAELLDEICLSDDASEGLKYLNKRTHYLCHKNVT